MSLMSVTWTLFRSPGMWDKSDLYSILGKGDQLFKFIERFRYLWMEDLPQELLVEKVSINLEFLKNKAGEITARAYLISISEIVNGFRKLGNVLYLLSAIIYYVLFREMILYVYLILRVKMRIAIYRVLVQQLLIRLIRYIRNLIRYTHWKIM